MGFKEASKVSGQQLEEIENRKNFLDFVKAVEQKSSQQFQDAGSIDSINPYCQLLGVVKNTIYLGGNQNNSDDMDIS